jgi:hypothetical protein
MGIELPPLYLRAAYSPKVIKANAGYLPIKPISTSEWTALPMTKQREAHPESVMDA